MQWKGMGDKSPLTCLYKQFLLPEILSFPCHCGKFLLTLQGQVQKILSLSPPKSLSDFFTLSVLKHTCVPEPIIFNPSRQQILTEYLLSTKHCSPYLHKGVGTPGSICLLHAVLRGKYEIKLGKRVVEGLAGK